MLMSGLGPLRGVRDVHTPLDQKKRGEQKLSLKSNDTNSSLEVVTHMVSTKKMSTIF